eukprot:6478463-Amphidinium_carterae.1
MAMNRTHGMQCWTHETRSKDWKQGILHTSSHHFVPTTILENQLGGALLMPLVRPRESAQTPTTKQRKRWELECCKVQKEKEQRVTGKVSN